MTMTGRKALFTTLLGAALLLPACDDTSGPRPLISLNETWHEQGNEQHTFAFADDADFIPRNAGVFEGIETLPGGTPQYPLEGSWSNGSVRFTVERAQSVTYTADFTYNSPDTLVFTSSAGNLTLIRN
jgi:hypothetical protein